MTRVAVVGATGFVGTRIRVALGSRGVEVHCVSAPRLTTPAREVRAVLAEVDTVARAPVMDGLASQLMHCEAVINAAGMAAATGHGDALYGANALLPALLAAATPSDARFVHISSAAVQGRREVLDESEHMAPFSPYSASKALGEVVVRELRPDAVRFRPTSVQGADREVTHALVRLLSSPLASVAGAGVRPTPQVSVENVADAAAFLALAAESPPGVVLHPSEQLTTADLVRLLGRREPRHIPVRLARAVVGAAYLTGSAVPTLRGTARRLEMLWFGQSQGCSWLDGRWTPVKGIEWWMELA